MWGDVTSDNVINVIKGRKEQETNLETKNGRLRKEQKSLWS
jgi:hypothetical protein